MEQTVFAFLVICLFLSTLTPIVTGGEVPPVEENNSTSFPCNIEKQDFPRKWYKGRYNAPQEDSKMIFYQHRKDSDVQEKPKFREGMSANKTTFEMTISKVNLEDDGFFTCEVALITGQNEYAHSEIKVYIQPSDNDIRIVVPEDLMAEKEVTASCTIERLFPKIVSKGYFTITWGKDSSNTIETANHPAPDKAFSHTVRLTKTLTDKDDGTIKCTLQPEIGNPVESAKPVNVI